MEAMTEQGKRNYLRCVNRARRGDIISIYVDVYGSKIYKPSYYTKDCLVISQDHFSAKTRGFHILVGIEDESIPGFWAPSNDTIDASDIPPHIKFCYFLYDDNCRIAKIRPGA